MASTSSIRLPQSSPGLSFRPVFDPIPDLDDSHIEITSETPVDNFMQELLRRLLASILEFNLATWCPDPLKRCIVSVDVGLFANPGVPGRAPDLFVSLGVKRTGGDQKKDLTYYFWEFGKPPELVLEIVSNRKGGERTVRKNEYEQMQVPYYVVFDPFRYLIKEGSVLECYEWTPTGYVLMDQPWLERLNLGLVLWDGEIQDFQQVHRGRKLPWLRWCDRDGNLLPMPEEQRDSDHQRLEQERQRKEAYAQRLRELGVDPDSIP